MVIRKLLMVWVMTLFPLVAGQANPHLVRLDEGGYLLADKVVVDKGDRVLMLMRDGYVVREYPVALGWAPQGHKQMKGDGRTPEGFYTLDWRNPNSRFYRSIHVSYPNEQDLAEARRLGFDPGGMIMIHGRPNFARTGEYGFKPDWTEGCIAVSNAAMDEIWELVADGTLIEIRP